ncbi:hypothetical protein CKO23_02870 [Thiocystis violacea]|nr:hypothetical protein [Thiocystis violacea]
MIAILARAALGADAHTRAGIQTPRIDRCSQDGQAMPAAGNTTDTLGVYGLRPGEGALDQTDRRAGRRQRRSADGIAASWLRQGDRRQGHDDENDE